MDICSKASYKTKNSARGGAAIAMGRSSCPYKIVVYNCPSCKMWHMTSQGKMENNANITQYQ